MSKQFDVLIIGGGIGGLMSAYRLKKGNPSLQVAIYEKGKHVEDRKCPAQQGKPCAHCGICAITSGYAGAGAFSDGKFNLGTAYGGTLGDALGEEVAMKYIKQVDEILHEHADPEDYPKIYSSNEGLKRKCLQNNLRLLDMDVRHLGTDRNLLIMKALIRDLESLGVSLFSDVTVTNVKKVGASYTVETQESSMNADAKKVIFAVGRGGVHLVTDFCQENDIPMKSNAVDIGVRVEMKDAIWTEFSSQIYEPKILCRTKTFEDKTRMFCFNKGGIVSAENNNGIITANGHAYSDDDKRT
ncbi:MAG: NAD(P)-binding protein, partial [Clostridia bacterium]|nr:NAD(P)-binding protein [Clostridia bacterium]